MSGRVGLAVLGSFSLLLAACSASASNETEGSLEQAADEIVEQEPADAPKQEPADAPEQEPADAPEQQPASSSDGYTGPLTFDWPSDCSIPVIEEVTNRGRVATLSYSFEVAAYDSTLTISYADLEILAIDGQPLSTGQLQAAAAGLAVPGYRVDSDGLAVGLVGVEELIGQMEAMGMDAQMLNSPSFLVAMEDAAIRKHWDSLVGFWAGLGSVSSAEYTYSVPVPIGSDVIDLDVIVESLEIAENGNARLRQTQVVEGQDMAKALDAQSQSLGSDNTTLQSVDDSQTTTIVEVVTDPQTLRPDWAQIEIEMKLGSGVGSQTRVERREWTLDWESSTCAP